MELLFRLICSRDENGSIILTSNKFFRDWATQSLRCSTGYCTMSAVSGSTTSFCSSPSK
ncbi:MAG: hypothetical protein ACERKO_12565 [Acetanaerobacterium sp.]